MPSRRSSSSNDEFIDRRDPFETFLLTISVEMDSFSLMVFGLQAKLVSIEIRRHPTLVILRYCASVVVSQDVHPFRFGLGITVKPMQRVWRQNKETRLPFAMLSLFGQVALFDYFG